MTQMKTVQTYFLLLEFICHLMKHFEWLGENPFGIILSYLADASRESSIASRRESLSNI